MPPPTIPLTTLALDALQFILGAALLGVFTYRVYDKRPKLDVPRTEEEIRAYKRTGRHPLASGYSGYTIAYGTPHPWLIAALAAAAALALAASLLMRHLGHARTMALLCAIAGLYCASLAALLLDELRRARHVRLAQLLDALCLPLAAHVLVVERLHGLLGVAAARRLPDGRTDIVLPDLRAVEATRINLRRASMATRAGADLVATHAGGYDAVLLQAPADAARLRTLAAELLPGGRAAITGTTGRARQRQRAATDTRLTWHRIQPAFTDRLLSLLSLGCIDPFAFWSGDTPTSSID